MILNFLRQLRKRAFKRDLSRDEKIKKYLLGGSVPWSVGYNEYKFDFIKNQINSIPFLEDFIQKKLPVNFGKKLDERAVEYPWIFSKLSSKTESLLDAGSTLNFEEILASDRLKDKELIIFTFHPESNCFYKKRISYVFGDLRMMPFKNDFFQTVICQSTIEHIDMDNSMYGYNIDSSKGSKSHEYLLAIDELIRVLGIGGKLLLTFPFGKYGNYGFFQQLDNEMLQAILDKLKLSGTFFIDFFKYEKEGWRFSTREDVMDVIAFNPHTGEGKGDDGAAHCRSIACIEFFKS